MDMETSKLGAAVKMREHFAGVQKMPGIKCAFQPLLLFQVILGELDVHQVAFLDTDTMFTGQHSAHLDTATQNIGTKFFGTLKLTGLICIEQDQRMEIAIAGMKHIGDPQPYFWLSEAMRRIMSGNRRRGIVPSMHR